MGLPIAPHSAVQEFIMHQEASLAASRDKNSSTNRLTRKVTVRLALHQYAALQLVSSRYDSSPTTLATHLFGAAALDAAELAGFTAEQLADLAQKQFRAEFGKAEQHQEATGDGLVESLAAVGLDLVNDEEEL